LAILLRFGMLLPTPGDTRWNSVNDAVAKVNALLSVPEQETKLDQLLHQLDIKRLQPMHKTFVAEYVQTLCVRCAQLWMSCKEIKLRASGILCLRWQLLRTNSIAKSIRIEYCNTFIESIGIAIANSFLTEYLYWYWQYFIKVLLTTLAAGHKCVNLPVTHSSGISQRTPWTRRHYCVTGAPARLISGLSAAIWIVAGTIATAQNLDDCMYDCM